MEQLSIEERIELSKEFGGIKGWYGLRLRPLSLGCAPKGHSAEFTHEQALALFPNLRDINNVRWGLVCFPEVLSEFDAERFDLVSLDKPGGIESKYAFLFPTSELEIELINTLALHFHKNGDAHTIMEIEYDPEYELKEAFKATSIFVNRKENIEQFNAFKNCLTQLNPMAVIARLVELKQVA